MRNRTELQELIGAYFLGIGIFAGGIIIIMIGVGIYTAQVNDYTEFAQLLLFIFCGGIALGGLRVMYIPLKEIKPFAESLEEWWGIPKRFKNVKKLNLATRIFYAASGAIIILIGILGASLWVIWCFHFNATAEFVSMGHIIGFIFVFVLIIALFLFPGYLFLRAFMRTY